MFLVAVLWTVLTNFDKVLAACKWPFLKFDGNPVSWAAYYQWVHCWFLVLSYTKLHLFYSSGNIILYFLFVLEEK